MLHILFFTTHLITFLKSLAAQPPIGTGCPWGLSIHPFDIGLRKPGQLCLLDDAIVKKLVMAKPAATSAVACAHLFCYVILEKWEPKNDNASIAAIAECNAAIYSK